MKKTIKILLAVTLAIICSFVNIPYIAKANSEIHIVEDAPNNTSLPIHFRRSFCNIGSDNCAFINKKGLLHLHISGSGQFSESGLKIIKEIIPPNFSIIDIDLREESHGFINGIAVSWKNEFNNANKGLTIPEITETEKALLNSIKIGEPITLYGKDTSLIPNTVQNEFELTKPNGILYERIPVTDGGFPTDSMVNYFINLVNNTPKDTWIHFHCKAGIGRTTTFMIMYDIMKNHKDVGLNDIIKRQVVLSKMTEKDAEDFYTGEHYKFLEKFYTDYVAKVNPITRYNTFLNKLSAMSPPLI